MRKAKIDEYNEKMKFIKILEIILISFLVISFGVLIYCIYISAKEYKYGVNEKEEETKELSANIRNDENLEIWETIENVNQSIVGISKLKNKGNTIFLSDSDESLGLGTGFIISEDGYIVTNEHISGEKFSSCYVTLENGLSYTGNVVWTDSSIDLSIIKISAENLEYVDLGDSDKLKVSQKVYAIGNPVGFEFQRIVTSGIVSCLDRTIKLESGNDTQYIEGLIQTDATINPGNSGGPLISEDGMVVGVNSAKIISAEGMGFAIPINIIKPVIKKIKQDKSYQMSILGIFAYDRNIIPYIKQDLGAAKMFDKGIYIAQVIENSPADKAGFKEGDILTEIDGVKLEKMSDLRKYIYSKDPGDEVKIKYLRNEREDEKIAILEKD